MHICFQPSGEIFLSFKIKLDDLNSHCLKTVKQKRNIIWISCFNYELNLFWNVLLCIKSGRENFLFKKKFLQVLRLPPIIPFPKQTVVWLLCSRCVYLFPLRNCSDSPVQSYSALCGQNQAVVALALKTRGGKPVSVSWHQREEYTVRFVHLKQVLKLILSFVSKCSSLTNTEWRTQHQSDTLCVVPSWTF